MYCDFGKMILTNLDTDDMTYYQLSEDIIDNIEKEEEKLFELLSDVSDPDKVMVLAG